MLLAILDRWHGLAGEGKMFSPGNLRATFDNPEYEKLISYWVGEKYTLRYTGGMVPDVFQVGLTLTLTITRVRRVINSNSNNNNNNNNNYNNNNNSSNDNSIIIVPQKGGKNHNNKNNNLLAHDELGTCETSSVPPGRELASKLIYNSLNLDSVLQ